MMSKIYTVWVDYGSEGWTPNDFETEKECIDFIMDGTNAGSRLRITEQRTINMVTIENIGGLSNE
jgi:hypothetical protein